MTMTTKTITGALAAALLATAPQGAMAQSTPAATSSITAGGTIAKTDSDTLTSEQIAANGEKTVIIHFISGVTYWTGLQLVVMVQEYYKNGYRKFLMPIQTIGGDVLSSMHAYETLSRMPIEFTTVATGNVDSAGVFLYCIGQKRYASPGASFLFHPISGSLNPNRRGEEAAERQIESVNQWVSTVHTDCFGEPPEAWDLERRDYRVMTDEASEVGLVNAGADYFEGVGDIGDVAYITYAPTYPSAQ